MIYSAEKFKDGTVIIFLHSKLGVIPYLTLSQVQLMEFIDMLRAQLDEKTDVPDVFKRAINGNEDKT